MKLTRVSSPAVPQAADEHQLAELRSWRDMLELDGADAFRLAAYRRAAALSASRPSPWHSSPSTESDASLRDRWDDRGQIVEVVETSGNAGARSRSCGRSCRPGSSTRHARSQAQSPRQRASSGRSWEWRTLPTAYARRRRQQKLRDLRSRRQDGGEGAEVAGGAAEGCRCDRPHAARQALPPCAAPSRRSRRADSPTASAKREASAAAPRRRRTST